MSSLSAAGSSGGLVGGSGREAAALGAWVELPAKPSSQQGLTRGGLEFHNKVGGSSAQPRGGRLLLGSLTGAKT